jgi:hypothetical protein
MMEPCRIKCEQYFDGSADKVPHKQFKRIISLKITECITVEVCSVVPNYKNYEIPPEVKEHPCYMHYSTIYSLVICGYGRSEFDNNQSVKLEVQVSNIRDVEIQDYLDLCTPGSILFVTGEYVLPSAPEIPLYIFNAEIMPVSTI